MNRIVSAWRRGEIAVVPAAGTAEAPAAVAAVSAQAGLATGTAICTAQVPVTDHERERQRRAVRRYYQNHRADVLERKAKWRQENPEAARARDRRYDADPVHYARHLERNRKWKQARRAAVAIGANAGQPAAAATARQPIPAVAANVAPV